MLTRRSEANATLPPALERMEKLARLEPNWDSYGALPPALCAIGGAHRLIATVTDLYGKDGTWAAYPWTVAPLADGGVQLEWRGPGGAIEVEIGTIGELAFLLEPSDSSIEPLEGEGVDEKSVCKLIGQVLGY